LVKYTVVVSVDPTDKPVLFGATANVVITTGAPHSMLAVPVGAVLSDSQGEYVLKVGANGDTERINIQSGDLSGNLVTVTTTSGDLKEGDQVEVGAVSTNNSNNNGGGGFRGPVIGP
jgi:HlyD family secretion protein/macrolide-specific efflux system membrane fusion protein